MRFGRKVQREQMKKEVKAAKKEILRQRVEPVIQQLSDFYFDRARTIVRQKPDQKTDFAFAQATSTHLSKSFPAWIEAESLRRAKAKFDLWDLGPEEFEKKEAEEKAAAEEKARQEAEAAEAAKEPVGV